MGVSLISRILTGQVGAPASTTTTQRCTNPLGVNAYSLRAKLDNMGTGELCCNNKDIYNAHKLLGIPRYNDICIA